MVDPRAVKALSHPMRIRILRFLSSTEMASANELAGEFGVALGSVGYHVRRLHALGFLELVKRVQRRGAVEHYYRLKPGVEAEASVRSMSRELLGRRRDGWSASRVLLDAPAIAALRPTLDQLFIHMRQLEAEAVRRTGIGREASSFAVEVHLVVEPDRSHLVPDL